MTLKSWIKWAFKPWPKGRHSFHSFALARQAERDLGRPVTHNEFASAMKAAGYRVVCNYGRAMYFDCQDSSEKHKYYRKRFIGCDETIKHPLELRQHNGACIY